MSLTQRAQAAGEAAYVELIESDQCTCETCVVREILTAAWDVLLELVAEETRTSVVVGDSRGTPSD